MGIFKAGSASIVVELGDDCFPNAESKMKHDDVYVRLVIMETDKRYAVLEADMPSMFPSEIKYVKQLLNDNAGVAPENSWIVVNHSFSSPHTWPLEAGEQKDTMRPKILDEDPEMMEKAKRINAAYKAAYSKAVQDAQADMREASIGYGAGTCGLNVNRNVETADGWWEGVNYDGYVDHHMGIVRINDTTGTPIAIFYNYSMKVDIMAGMFNDIHGKVTSSDCVGAASKYVEDEFEGCTAIFMCGATGDQAPIFKINYDELDKDGHTRKGSFGTEGFGILAAMGQALGNTILQISQKVVCDDAAPAIKTGKCTYTCNCQKRDANMHKLHPTRTWNYVPEGSRDLTIDVMVIGDIAFVGLLPELDGITVAEIREQSPYDKTVVSCFVNGNSKSMPRAESYKLIQKQSMNSPFVEGSAEITRDAALALLGQVKNA